MTRGEFTALLSRWLEAPAAELRPWRRTVVIGIAGAQGSGKTTLMRDVCGQIGNAAARVVTVSIDDFYVTHDEQSALARRHPGNRFLPAPRLSRNARRRSGVAVLTAPGRSRAGSSMQLPGYDRSALTARGSRSRKRTGAVDGPRSTGVLEGSDARLHATAHAADHRPGTEEAERGVGRGRRRRISATASSGWQRGQDRPVRARCGVDERKEAHAAIAAQDRAWQERCRADAKSPARRHPHARPRPPTRNAALRQRVQAGSDQSRRRSARNSALSRAEPVHRPVPHGHTQLGLGPLHIRHFGEDRTMRLTWLGHPGFRIEIEDQVLLLDPGSTATRCSTPPAATRRSTARRMCCSPTATGPQRTTRRHRQGARHPGGRHLRPDELLGAEARHRRPSASTRAARSGSAGSRSPWLMRRTRPRSPAARGRSTPAPSRAHDRRRGPDDLCLRRHRRDGRHGASSRSCTTRRSASSAPAATSPWTWRGPPSRRGASSTSRR